MIVTRVPPPIGPDVGCNARTMGVRTADVNVKPDALTTRCSAWVPACVMTITSAAWVVPAARSIAGVTTVMDVLVNAATKPSLTVPLPRSKRTRIGPLKFVPVIVSVSPPCGLPVFGVMLVIVGVVDGGGGVTG